MAPEPPSTEGDPAPSGRREIVIQNPCRYRQVAARRLRPWLEALVAELAPAARSFGVRFVSDREMRRLNHTYRDRDRPTDVLSFPGQETGSFVAPTTGHLGDVVIAVPTAGRQAAARGVEVARELRLLLLHGLLHCLGHDHERDDGTMARLERRLRARWIDGVGDG